MKIVSFNVNGIRAIISKDFANDFDKLNADIFSINETKLSDGIDFPFSKEGYEIYYTNSKERKGYSGVAIITRIKPISIHYGLKEGKYDNEGRVITLEFEFFFYIACYVPNSGDGLKRMDYRMQFEEDMLEYIKELDKKKPVIYGGDLNVAHKEIDIINPKANENNAGYTIQERTAFSRLLDNGFIDTFRYLHPNEVKYSWWSYRFFAREHNSGWRIDYFIVSQRLINKIKESNIHNDIFGSDHCPISIEIIE